MFSKSHQYFSTKLVKTIINKTTEKILEIFMTVFENTNST